MAKSLDKSYKRVMVLGIYFQRMLNVTTIQPTLFVIKPFSSVFVSTVVC